MASDLYEEAPVWYLRVKQAAQRGATLIVANPRETKLDRYASFVMCYAYGDEVKTAQVLTKKGKIGDAFIKAENAVILFGSEGLGLEASTALATALCPALNDTGHVGKPNNGLIGVWPRANDQGAWEIGFHPEVDLQAAFDKAEAVYIVGADPFGDGALKIKSGRRKPFIVVQDLFETEDRQTGGCIIARPGIYRAGGDVHIRRTPCTAVSIKRFRRWRGRKPILQLHPRLPNKWASSSKVHPLPWSSTSWPQIICPMRG